MADKLLQELIQRRKQRFPIVNKEAGAALEDLLRPDPTMLPNAADEDLPPVPKPYPFGPEPIVVGQDTAQEAESLFRFSPQLRQAVSQIIKGFGPSQIRSLASQIRPELPAFVLNKPGQSSSMGAFGRTQRDISIDPTLPAGEVAAAFSELGSDFEINNNTTLGILAHELRHAAGDREESGNTDLAEMLAMRALFGKNKPAPTLDQAINERNKRLNIGGK